MINRKFLLSLLILCSSISLNVTAQNNDANIIESLNKKIKPITTFQPDSNFQDLNFLKETLKDKNIIGLGEATHGTHDFFKFKDRLIRFLVTNLNYKAIAFESDFLTVLNLNAYINGKIDKMFFSGGFPVSMETKEMLTWLKTYNQTKTADEKVQIYGLETRAFNNITELLLDSLPNLTEANKRLLLKFKNTHFNQLTKKDVNELKLILPSLYELAVGESSSLHKFYVRLLEQEILQYYSVAFGIRDNHMLENLSWIYKNTSNNKVIIWAHNGHLAKTNIFKQAPLGKQVYQIYGDKYYVIATDFNHGETGVYVQQGKEWIYQDLYYPEVQNKSYEYYFSKCKSSNFFIDMIEASKEEVLGNFLHKEREMRSIGGTDKPANSKLSMASCFDLVAFFNRTTAIK
jgi:erythromycin esterase